MKASKIPALEDVNLVVKRHTHDVRNALNGMEIELALLEEFSSGHDDVKEAVHRLRQAANEIGKLMQGLSAKLGMEPPKAVLALQVAERWRSDALALGEEISLIWEIDLTDETVWVNSAMVRTLLQEVLELLTRSNPHRTFNIRCQAEGRHVVMGVGVVDGLIRDLRGLGALEGYWSALRAIAGCAEVMMLPETLGRGDSGIRIMMPRAEGVAAT